MPDCRQRVFEIKDLGAEDLQRALVGMIGDHNRHIPAGHCPVEQPAAGEAHHVGDIGGHDVEPIPHAGFGGAISRANDSEYSLNTSVSGIEGLISHVVSIPVMKARICTALTVTSISMRNWPARWPRRMSSVMMSIALW